MPARKKMYSDKQKAAYYKKKAMNANSLKVVRPRIRGHGDYEISKGKYKGHGAYLGAGLGSAVGSVVAPGVGTVLGAPIGAALGYAADKIFGWGDYTIKKNSLVGAGGPPLFEGPDYIRIRHREYIGDISSTTTFSNRSFPINPGLATTFPWLSAIADQFEQYRFNGLLFEFVSTSADALNSTNTALGSVILATDYDAEDNAFANQAQMLSTMFSNSGKPSCNILHAIECAPDSLVTQWLYVRSSSISSGPDARLYDLGNFQLATYGSQAAAVIGQLWCTYDVVFQKAQMNNILGLSLKSDHFKMVAPSTSNYFGTNYAAISGVGEAGSNLGCTLGTADIYFPSLLSSGTYLFVYTVNGASTASLSVPTRAYTNCSVLQLWNNAANTGAGTVTGTTSTQTSLMMVVKIFAQNASINFSGGVLPTSPTYGDLWITQVNGNITT